MTQGRIHVGTSGYVYRHWRSRFYPADLPAASWLAYYARHFPTVELNATFYRLPTPHAAAGWRARVPSGFVFACKGSRYLTHMKRLRDVGTGLERFFTPLAALGPQLEVVLWQLPPQMDRPDPGRLDAFLEALPHRPRRVLEFRDASWHVRDVCRVLERHGAALCEHDLLPPSPVRPDVPFRYLRFHGTGGRYAGRYGSDGLRAWARTLEGEREDGRDAYVYFNNDGGAAAVQDARDLLQLLDKPAVTSRRDPAPSRPSG